LSIVTDSREDTPEGKPLTRSEEKRAQIVEAASRLFIESGYGAISMDVIAAEAGVSKRTVYSHFEDKNALFIAVMDAHCEAMGGNRVLHDAEGGSVYVPEDIAEGLTDRSTRTVLIAFTVRFLRIVLSQRAIRIFRVIQGEAVRFPELAQNFEMNATDPMIRRLSAFFSERVARGALTMPDLEMAAWRLIAIVKEPYHFALCLGRGQTPSLEEIEAHAADSVDFFLRAHDYRPEKDPE
jgi:TetR/AcrR family transcriptional repressor of mexJK operon